MDGLNIDLRSDVAKKPQPPGPPRSPLRLALDWVWDVIRSWGPALLVVLVIRSILVEPFQIPSGSMVPTLAIGDFIGVSKFSYGLRVPFTEIELVPLGEPERGDIVVFIHPPSVSKDDWCWLKRIPRGVTFDLVRGMPGPGPCTTDYIKRVVALPGDTVEVRDDVIWVNGVEQARTFEAAYPYRHPKEQMLGGDDDPCVNEEMKQFEENLDGRSHPVLQSTSWARHAADYGPAKVPEGQFFMMGDNRDNSLDSRFWGFVPRDHVRGKAKFVWLSFDSCARGFDKIRWGRIGQALR